MVANMHGSKIKISPFMLYFLCLHAQHDKFNLLIEEVNCNNPYNKMKEMILQIWLLRNMEAGITNNLQNWSLFTLSKAQRMQVLAGWDCEGKSLKLFHTSQGPCNLFSHLVRGYLDDHLHSSIGRWLEWRQYKMSVVQDNSIFAMDIIKSIQNTGLL